MENKTIIFASNSKEKTNELKLILSSYNILTLNDIGFVDEIEETGSTFLENATIKANAVKKFLGKNYNGEYILADDSGLCVDALNGAPGVYSARLSGDHDVKANRQKLLSLMQNETNRNAHFTCCIVCLKDEKILVCEGRCDGKILAYEDTQGGFAYDCIFYSNDLKKSFGVATKQEKNSVSHRGRALEKLVKQLNNF